MQEIGIDYLLDSEIDENGDKIHIAKGLNGILYRLVECRHNPTHTNTHLTIFDNAEAKIKFEKNILSTDFEQGDDQSSNEQSPKVDT